MDDTIRYTIYCDRCQQECSVDEETYMHATDLYECFGRHWWVCPDCQHSAILEGE